jgi:hypothetical protein
MLDYSGTVDIQEQFAHLNRAIEELGRKKKSFHQNRFFYQPDII